MRRGLVIASLGPIPVGLELSTEGLSLILSGPGAGLAARLAGVESQADAPLPVGRRPPRVRRTAWQRLGAMMAGGDLVRRRGRQCDRSGLSFTS